MRALIVAALFLMATSGCRDNTNHIRPPVDAGLVCGDNERVVAGECVFVCDRDGDCPLGERCNLLIGACEPKPPPADAGPLATCTTGAARCRLDHKAVETCQENGTWQVTETCAPPFGYCLHDTCLTCQPGATWCDPANPQTATACLPDGSATRAIACAGAAVCAEGECRECTPDTGRCSIDGKTAQTCQRTSDETLTWAWTNAGDALDGTCITQACETPTPSEARCVPPACFPGATQCKNNTTQQLCGATGAWQDVVCSAIPGNGPGAECINGVCIDECKEAERAKSYYGCEYWSAVQDNGVDRFFKGGTSSGQGTSDSDFAFVVSNRSASEATVVVSRWYNGAIATVKSVTVPGRADVATKGLAIIKVPWQSLGSVSDGLSVSGMARYGYRITSNRPITVYQFSPLDAVRYGPTCSTNGNCTQAGNAICQSPPAGGAKVCNYFTYSNDASLLLPAHILGNSYVAMSSEHIKIDTGGGQSIDNAHLTIVGTQDGTTVTVKAAAPIRAGPGVVALSKGQTQTFTLNSFDVLQLASDLPNPNSNVECADDPFDPFYPLCLFGCAELCRIDTDLTGTIVTSDKPIAVFGGSRCTTVPYNKTACDHLEEQLFPFVTWGKHFVATRTAPLRLQSGAFASAANAGHDYYKIVAGCSPVDCPNGTELKLSQVPSSADILNPVRCVTGTSLTANNCRLMGGQFVAFRSRSSFTITADQPISVGQFFAGQNATTGSDAPAQGDPSFVLLPPVEQWRSSYTVLSAPGIKDNYLAIAIDEAKVAGVEVDGTAVPLSGFSAIAGTSFRVKNHPITVGTHTLTVIPKPGLTEIPGAGVTVYGYDSYVSYGYTGGLDLGTIVTGINPGG